MKVRPFLWSLIVAVALTSLSAFAQPSSDISVTKSGPSTAAAGTDVAYDIFLVNLGPDDSAIVTLNDNLPAGMTFNSLVQNNGPTFSCSDPGVGNNGSVTCTVATMTSGSSADFTLTVHIAPATPPSTFFTNTATVSCATDPSSENDSSTAVTSTPSNDADVSVTKNGPSSAAPDSDVAYTISVVNNGPATATTVVLNDTLPGTMTFVSVVQNTGPAFTCGGTVTCSIASMASGASATFTLTGHIPSNTPSGTTFDNTATVSSDADPNSENNASTVTTTVSSTDVAVTKSGPASVTAGTNLSYTITVTNNGPDTAQSVDVFDNYPPQTTFVSFVQNTGPAASCAPAGLTSASCSFVSPLANGATATFTLTVNVPVTVPNGTVLVNNVDVSTGSFDNNSANNTSQVSTTVIGVTDLAVSKSGPGSVTAGSDLTYTIAVTNSGASAATGAALSDTLPANVTFVSEAQNTGPAASCSTPAVGSSGGTITCTWASLPAGASATFTVIVHVPGNATGSVTNTANVSSTTGDTNTANDSSTTTATIIASADVNITKSGPSPVIQDQDVTYTIVVNNAGPSTATSVTMTDNIPAGTTFVSLGQSGAVSFNCTTPPAGGTGPVTCSAASFPAGSTTTFTLIVHTGPATTAVTNTASVSSATSDPNPANNSATANSAAIPIGSVPALSTVALMLLAGLLAAIALMTRR